MYPSTKHGAINYKHAGYLAKFWQGYLDCAFWSETHTEDLDSSDVVPLEDVACAADMDADTLAELKTEVYAFVWANRRALRASGLSPGQAGHDFWLTRNGHGAGFWDRGLGDLGEDLSRAAKECGTRGLYIGDDGKVYSHG